MFNPNVSAVPSSDAVPQPPAAAAANADAAATSGPAPVTFESLGLSQALLRDLAQAKFTEPTPIQAKAIPPAMQGKDVLGCAQTGTGKTAAFVIPMVERLAGGPVGPPRGLILAPTRELAFQIQRTVALLGRNRGVSATTVIGGEDIKIQVRGLNQKPTIVVATPGRLLDHMWNGTINLAHFSIVVLDEADRMLDMGFAPQLNQILDALPLERQTMLFSATIPADLSDLARAGLQNPVRIMVNPPAQAAHTVTHEVHHTTRNEKTDLLLKLIQDFSGSVLVFTRTKHGADKVGRVLEQKGHRVAVLHAGRRLSQRKTALEGFRRGNVRVLVATDIAARGIDVANIGHVVNYDLPNTPEDYVHRIGRTGRMKTEGRATSFVTGEDHFQLRAIEKLLGRPVPRVAGSPEPAFSHSHGGHSRPHQGGRPGGPGGAGRPFQRPQRPQGQAGGFERRDAGPRVIDGNRREQPSHEPHRRQDGPGSPQPGYSQYQPQSQPQGQPQGQYPQRPAPRPRRWMRTPQQ